jgi:uncharacterized protein (DUF849 family)
MKIKPVILTCAITGGIHTPTMSPYLPITSEEITKHAIDAVEAGASIIHLHARNEENGKPTSTPDAFLKFLPKIKEKTNAILNLSTGGSPGMTVEERLMVALTVKPEMASLNMGSMNFCLYPLLDKYKKWKFPWEPKFLEMTKDFIFKNTFNDIETSLIKLGKECGTQFEFECYDVSHLYNLAYFVDHGFIKPPFLIQTIFGLLGGIGADMENLFHMRRIAIKLFGEDHEWSVLAAGRHQIPFATTSANMGGNVRVGLEDSLFIEKGKLAKNNAEQVTKIHNILKEMSFVIATPDEVRERLNLKGKNNVGF